MRAKHIVVLLPYAFYGVIPTGGQTLEVNGAAAVQSNVDGQHSVIQHLLLARMNGQIP